MKQDVGLKMMLKASSELYKGFSVFIGEMIKAFGKCPV